MSLEKVIFENLITNEDYARAVIPFLKKEYFSSHNDKVIFEIIDNYVIKYNTFPTKEVVQIDLSNRTDISDDQFAECKEFVSSFNNKPIQIEQQNWILAETEKFCQDKAIYNAIMQSIKIMDGSEKDTKGVIPQLLSDALSISFDTSVGHDFLEDGDERYDFYHRREERIPFDIDYLNKITKGGIPRKTLTIILGGIGTGKSLCMCHMAAGNLAAGMNVLYITLELAEERVAERIDANLLDVSLDDLYMMSKEAYDKKMNRLKGKTTGKLIIKEYPTSSAGAANFRHLLNELKVKKGFVPDVVYVDYINLCVSSRFKNNGNLNSNSYIKAVAEELRGLAVETNVPLISATQITRSGLYSTDVDLTNTAEAISLPATADIMFAVMSSDELAELGQYLVKQLKNRFSDINIMNKFVIGVDKSKMRLYNVEDSAQPKVQTTVEQPQTEKPKLSKDVFDAFR